MLEANAAVTVWVPKFLNLFFIIACIVVVATFVERPLLLRSQTGSIARLEVAKTEDQLTKGLGDRKEMSNKDGMLFELPPDSESCFWMKDMQFPLDIIWADTNKRVTHLTASVDPGTYPKSFCGPIDTPYVIELKAGAAARNNISVGTALNW